MRHMMHPQHGWQMVQPADIPMFRRAGWVECVKPEPAAIAEPVEPVEPEQPEPEKPKRRGRK